MAYVINPAQTGIDLTEVGTTAKVPLGQIVQADDGGYYQYVKNNVGSALTQGQTAIIDKSSFLSALVNQTNDDTAPVALGVSQLSTGIASGSYGWVFVGPGPLVVSALASCNPDVLLYTTTTAGSVDDASASAKVIQGLKLTVTNGGATAVCAAHATGKLQITT